MQPNRVFSLLRIQIYASFVLVSLLLNACGFYLRGDWALDEKLVPISVTDNGSESKIRQVLVGELNDARIPVVLGERGATEIELKDESFTKVLLSATGISTIDTYNVQYELKYQIRSNGNTLVAWQNLNLNRTLQFRKDAVLSSATEEDALHDDLVNDAAAQILTRLRFIKVPSKTEPDKSSASTEIPAASGLTQKAQEPKEPQDPQAEVAE